MKTGSAEFVTYLVWCISAEAGILVDQRGGGKVEEQEEEESSLVVWWGKRSRLGKKVSF